MQMPTPEHIIYIPAVFLFGLVVGWIWGGKAVRKDIERQKERDAAREKRRADRAARRAEREAEDGP